MYCDVPLHVARVAVSGCTGVTVNVTQFVVPARHALAVALTLSMNDPTESWLLTSPLASLILCPLATLIPALPVHVTACPARTAPEPLSTSACTGHSTIAPKATKRFGVRAAIEGGVVPVNSVTTLFAFASEAVTCAGAVEVGVMSSVAVPSPLVITLHELCPQLRAAAPCVSANVTVTPAAGVWLVTLMARTVTGCGTPIGTAPIGAATSPIASSDSAS